MIRSRFLRSLVALAALTAGGAAFAQSPQCQRYRAELAAMGQGGGNQAAAAAERQRQEIVRLVSYYKSIGCERGGLANFFGAGPVPPECGSINRRIEQAEASYDRLRAQAADAGGSDARRQQLLIAIEQTCNAPQQEAAGPRGFFESLFGPPRGARGPAQAPLDGELPPEEGEVALGGGRLICVRTCDGYAFPLSNQPAGGRDGADEMCQALCPGAETAAFSAPSSDDALERAVSLKGTPYRSLPGAFKFQKTFDASCTCKKEGESWAQILARAESMIGPGRGDVLVTAQKAEELSRARPAAPPAPAQRRPDPKRAAVDAAEAQAAADAGASAPTASQESSGIGPKAIETDRVVARGEGRNQEVVSGDGTKRVVRVVAPNLIPVPIPEKAQ